MSGTRDGEMGPETVVRAASGNVHTELEDEVVILDLERGAYFGLQEVGKRIWSLLKEPMTVASLESTILSEYDVERDRCREDLRSLLRELRDRGLVTVDPGEEE